MKPTQGDWIVWGDHGTYIATAHNRKTKILARMDPGVPTTEARANALLMAAAPDLLNALRAAMHAADVGCFWRGDASHAVALAAIAKAEGKP